MQLGMVGLGRMGSNMAQRLISAGHECVVYDVNPRAVAALEAHGAVATGSLANLVDNLKKPRAVWLMVPAALVEALLDELAENLDSDDVIIDGGNSYYKDAIRRATLLQRRGIHFVDVGTSGGVHGLERGYCQMIGGDHGAVARLAPVFESLAPGRDAAVSTPDRPDERGTAELGYLHCGPPGAGHFVKMVHNGIEYGLMQAFAEGFNLLKAADVGRASRAADAETSPLREPKDYQYEFDVGEIAELWRRGSVVSSWLLDLIAHALIVDRELDGFSGEVSDSGEGRWTVLAAVEAGVPATVLSASLFARFGSRNAGDFANRLLSAMRAEFGGHSETHDP